MDNKKRILDFLNNTDIPLSVISKDVGVSRNTLYNWLKGGPIRLKNEKTFISYINTKITLTGEHNMEAQYIIDLQKEKIERLEADIEKHKLNPVQSTHWDSLEYDFLVKVRLSFKGLKMGKTIVEVERMDNIIQILGYSSEEMNDLWDIGTYYKEFDRHPIDTILTKDSIDVIKQKNTTLPMVFNQLKDMVGNHYIPLPVSYKAKDKTVVHTISYNKVNWPKKTVESKVQILNS